MSYQKKEVTREEYLDAPVVLHLVDSVIVHMVMYPNKDVHNGEIEEHIQLTSVVV
jgi:hypothetical protein